ncbi:MAG: hypothetical protein IT359_10940 [Gemmatimonadaceae bacterium]|nr:hypothetical protein [Gemmatimonadaceae bacterium]
MNQGNLARVAPLPAPRQPSQPPSREGPSGLRSSVASVAGAPRPIGAAQPSRAVRASHVVTVVVLVVLGLANLAGAPYYLASTAERVRDPMHKLLRPSGLVGQSAGIAAFLIFAFLWLYPLRKKYRALAFTGAIGKWLDVHVTSALGLPLILTIHAAWRSQGVIGIGFASMLVVCASGIVGRYLYVRIPRAKSGAELSREQASAERNRLVDEIADMTGLHPLRVEETLALASPTDETAGVLTVLRDLVTNDVNRWRRTRELRRRFTALDVGRVIPPAALSRAVRLADREIALTQQLRMLDATQRVFRYWHIAHRPFALTALVAVVVHVAVVIAVGATWFY